MRSSFRFIFLIFMFLLLFFSFSWLLFPWEGAGSFVLGRIQNELQTRGVYVNYEDLNRENLVDPVLVMKDTSLVYLMGNLQVGVVKVSPDIVSSILSLKPSLRVSLQEGIVFIGGEESGTFGNGEFILRVLPGKIFVDEVSFKGDISASGDMVFDTSAGGINSASLVFRVPEKLEVFLKALSRSRTLNKNNSGEWQFIIKK